MFACVNIQAQCFECPNYHTELIEDVTPRFWEDPDGNSYPADDVFSPDKIGQWTYYKHFQNGDKVVISTRYVHCINHIEGRIRSKKNDITIYPNPANNHFDVVNNNSNGNIQIEVLDVLGKSIYQIDNAELNQRITVSDWSNGIYSVFVTVNGVSNLKKVSIVK